MRYKIIYAIGLLSLQEAVDYAVREDLHWVPVGGPFQTGGLIDHSCMASLQWGQALYYVEVEYSA